MRRNDQVQNRSKNIRELIICISSILPKTKTYLIIKSIQAMSENSNKARQMTLRAISILQVCILYCTVEGQSYS